MLSTPPKQHQPLTPKLAPAKKRAKKKPAK
jgi:hypothetical protein